VSAVYSPAAAIAARAPAWAGPLRPKIALSAGAAVAPPPARPAGRRL